MYIFDKKILKPFLIFLGFIFLSVFFYVVGYQIGFQSWGKQISISLDPTLSVRGLASSEDTAKNIAAVSYAKYSNPQHLFDTAKIFENSPIDNVSFVTGNLLYTDEQGNTSFICQNFSQVQLMFEAYGVAMDGEKVIMKVSTDCTVNEDHQYIGPFTIPAKKILESPIVKEKIKGDSSEIEFENVSLSWPKSWMLIRADFKKEGVSDFSVISKQPETEDDVFVIEL